MHDFHKNQSQMSISTHLYAIKFSFENYWEPKMNSTWLPSFNENCCGALYAITHQWNSKVSGQIKLQATEGPERMIIWRFQWLVLNSLFYVLQLRPLPYWILRAQAEWIHSSCKQSYGDIQHSFKGCLWGFHNWKKVNKISQVQSVQETECSTPQRKQKSKALGITGAHPWKAWFAQNFYEQT